jgi:hypothetical protein
MSKGAEYYNLDEVWPLKDNEVSNFINNNIWSAAEYYWGEDFYDPDKAKDRDDISWQPNSEEFEGKIEISLHLLDDTDYLLDDDGSRLSEEGIPDIKVVLYLEGYRADVTEIFHERYNTEVTVWEVEAYEFAVNGSTPLIYRYYSLRAPDGDEIDRPRKRQRQYLENIARSGTYSLPQRRRLVSQDCIDVHNILLAMEVPAEKISLSTN